MTPAPVPSVDRPVRVRRASSRLRKLLFGLGVAALALPSALRAQAYGALDKTFTYTPLAATAYAVNYVMDVDGTVKITLGGDGGLGLYLLTNGVASSDFFFPSFGAANRYIYTIVPEQVIAADATLPNLLMAGTFGRWQADNGAPRNIVRIMPIGTLDTNFETNIGTGANAMITSLLPLADGRIVVGGQFTVFNSEPRRRIVRLLNSGSIDESFATGLNIDYDVLTLAEGVDPASGAVDGTTLVAGTFNHVAGQAYAKLCRLDPNGNLDLTFHPVIDTRVLAIYVQADGKIVIGGDFTNVNGVACGHLARLNYDGSLDTTFSATVTGVPNKDVHPTAVYVLKPIADGRVYVGGEFAAINGVTLHYLGLITADGSVDTSFNPVTDGADSIYDSVQCIAIQADNNILVGETRGPKNGKNEVADLVRIIGVTPSAAATQTASAQTQVVSSPATTTTTRAKTQAPARTTIQR